jgi:CheY-like chemotaxis protein
VREVHHRIKNNLQGVAGLLQQNAERHPEVAPDADRGGRARCRPSRRSTACRSARAGRCAWRMCCEAIAASVQRTFGRSDRGLRRRRHAGRWLLPEAESIPIALTVNELLTNAIKHGRATACVALTSVAGDEAAASSSPARAAAAGLRPGAVPGGVSGPGPGACAAAAAHRIADARAAGRRGRGPRDAARAQRGAAGRPDRHPPGCLRHNAQCDGAQQGIGADEPPSKGRILVVDDDRLVLATVVHGLVQAGYDVIDADNGDDAILLAREHKPELALLDIRMEGKSGFDVAEPTCATCAASLHVPVGLLRRRHGGQGAVAGRVAYLVKPLDVGQIVPTVDAALARCAPVRGRRRRPTPLRGHTTAARPVAPRCWRDVVADGRGRGDAPLLVVARQGLAAAAAPGRRAGPVGRSSRPSGWCSRSRNWPAAAWFEAEPGGLVRQREEERSHRGPGSDSAQTSPPWRCTMRRTEASPTPCPESPWRCAGAGTGRTGGRPTRMSKPAPLSRTTNTRVPAHVHRRSHAELDVRLRVALAVLPGVAQQVLEHQAQQRGVAMGDQAGFDVDLGRRSGAPRRAGRRRRSRQLRQVDRLARQRLGRQPRHRQQRVDHQVHARTRPPAPGRGGRCPRGRARRRSPP